jgi:hypothetical protein
MVRILRDSLYYLYTPDMLKWHTAVAKGDYGDLDVAFGQFRSQECLQDLRAYHICVMPAGQ